LPLLNYVRMSDLLLQLS